MFANLHNVSAQPPVVSITAWHMLCTTAVVIDCRSGCQMPPETLQSSSWSHLVARHARTRHATHSTCLLFTARWCFCLTHLWRPAFWWLNGGWCRHWLWVIEQDRLAEHHLTQAAAGLSPHLQLISGVNDLQYCQDSTAVGIMV